MTEELRQDIQRRVQALQRHYQEGGRLLRSVWVLGAVVVTLVGVAMTVLPGPAAIVIPAGIAMLAVRFRWAQIVLSEVIDAVVRVQRRIARTSPLVRASMTAGFLVVGAGIAVALLR